MDGFLWFLLGALVSIPISIFSPLATQRIYQFVARRNERQARIRNIQLKREFEQIHELYENHEKFISYIVERILILTIVSALGTLFSNLLYSSGSFVYYVGISRDEFLYATFSVMGRFVIISTAAITIGIGVRTLRVRSRVLNFPAYRRSVQSQIEEIGGTVTEPAGLGNA